MTAKKQPKARAKWKAYSIVNRVGDLEVLAYEIIPDQLPAMVERMARELYYAEGGLMPLWRDADSLNRAVYREKAERALKAIGIRVPKRALQRGEGVK